MPSKKKKYNARFPPARIKKIMQTDDEVGKVAAAVPVIISRALELFVEALVKNSSEITKARNAKTLTTSHLKACILADGHYHFLKDLVATIPDVQGEEEPGTPLPLEGQPAVVAPRQPRGRKPKNRNGESTPGPSHSTAEESESASDEDEDVDVDSEDSETTCTSDNQVPAILDSRLPRNQEIHYLAMNQIKYSTTSSSMNNNTEDDDDYDS